jgi:hypothetical protein
MIFLKERGTKIAAQFLNYYIHAFLCSKEKRGKRSEKASPALAAFCAQGSAKFTGAFPKQSKQK